MPTSSIAKSPLTLLLFFSFAFHLCFIDSCSSHLTAQQYSHKIADLSFVVMDLKYNHEQGVKICEIQRALVSGFNSGKDRGDAISTGLLNIINRFWRPANCYHGKRVGDRLVLEKMKHRGWKKVEEAVKLKANLKQYAAEPINLSGFRGAVYGRIYGLDGVSDAFRKKHPDLLMIDRVTAPVICNKQLAHDFIKNDFLLSKRRPACESFQANYSPELAETILSQIDSEYLIIKPPAAAYSDGVIPVTRDALDELLKQLFTTSPLPDDVKDDANYLYWRQHQPATFLVEEFIYSEPIVHPDYPKEVFDPTLRVVAALIYNNGKLNVEFLGKYWKFPSKGWYSAGPFSQKHIALVGERFRVEVEDEIWLPVRDQLRGWLTRLYDKLLDRYEANKLAKMILKQSNYANL